MSVQYVIRASDNHKIGHFRSTKVGAMDYLKNLKGFAPASVIQEVAFKPEDKDVEVHWVLLFSIDETVFEEVYSTRKRARAEKKYLQEHDKATNLRLERRELWVVKTTKVS